jgi:hypothetical protein
MPSSTRSDAAGANRAPPRLPGWVSEDPRHRFLAFDTHERHARSSAQWGFHTGRYSSLDPGAPADPHERAAGIGHPPNDDPDAGVRHYEERLAADGEAKLVPRSRYGAHSRLVAELAPAALVS